GLLEVAYALAEQREVEALAAAQAQGGADDGAGAVGDQGADQRDVLAQGAEDDRREADDGGGADQERGAPAEEAECHQAGDHAGADQADALEQVAQRAVERDQFRPGQAEQGHGNRYRPGEGAVGHPVPVEAGDHRDHDRAPQRAHEHQHDQDVQAQAGEDDPDHGGHDHGGAPDQQHDLRVRALAGEVLAVDVGHHDRRQGGEIGVGGGGKRADHEDEEHPDRERRQELGRHLRDQVVVVAVERGDAGEQRQQAEHAQADHDRAIADGGGDERRLDQVLAHREQ